MARCQFVVGRRVVAEIALPGADGQIPPAVYTEEETLAMSKVLISLPEDIEQVLQSMIERDPDKGAELLRAGFDARLAELYRQR